MARIKQLKKSQRRVNHVVRSLNKHIKEDCFAGRFIVLQTGRKDFHWDDDYYSSNYEFHFMDLEQPERSFKKWFPGDSLWSLRHNIYEHMNNLIVESDFWNKWHHDQEYRNNHWYSGKQKIEAEAFGITKQLKQSSSL
ncbi:MAG: hypothetical protein Q4B60_08970 [Erysipelotrichaceae bacterium]|nr:hypothetical protein [Erysipelotrichaceae bacterium]